MTGPSVDDVLAFLTALQDRVCARLDAIDGEAHFGEDLWRRPEGGGGRTRVLAGGRVIEQAGAGLSHVFGPGMPQSASARRPDLAGRPFQALGVSVIVHPLNPYAPTSHMNVRFFSAGHAWWFGGGCDLTPFYGFDEDATHFHRTLRDACAPWGDDVYPRFKRACDEYFTLPHRREQRGVGGIFFDDLDAWGPDRTFAFVREVGDAWLSAYVPILERRVGTPWGERERDFQLYRRGRYVEFNLVHDRGTLFGLQSGGRAESILMSLPPLVRWRYGWAPEPGSPEARLTDHFLRPRDWV